MFYEPDRGDVSKARTTEGFKCPRCDKICKNKGGLTRHETIKHVQKTDLKIDIDTVKMLLINTQNLLSENKCFPEHLREQIQNYQANPTADLIQILNNIYDDLAKSKDADAYYTSVCSIIVLNASNYIPELEKPASTLIAQKLADKVFHHFKQPHDISTVKVPSITEKEMGGLQYLAGYTVKKILNRSFRRKNHNLLKNRKLPNTSTCHY